MQEIGEVIKCVDDMEEMTSDAPLNSSKDTKVGLKAKQRKKKRVGAHSLICNTLKEEGLLEL
jgi:hypothetical protein